MANKIEPVPCPTEGCVCRSHWDHCPKCGAEIHGHGLLPIAEYHAKLHIASGSKTLPAFELHMVPQPTTETR